VSAPEPTTPETTPAQPALELLWQDDATAYALVRTSDGNLSSGHLHIGMPAVADLTHLGRGTTARRVSLRELIELSVETALPAGVVLGGSAQATLAVIEVAGRSVAEGLVHPQLQHGGGSWLAFWGATLDESVQDELSQIAAALPAVCADAFDGDRAAAVHDLYACAVDQIARDRLRETGVRLGGRANGMRASALALFLDGLTAREPELPSHSGYAALERRIAAWVDEGLERRSSAPWLLGLRLDERPTNGTDGDETEQTLTLELWLQAADDPTLTLPASLLWEGGDAVFSFLRASDPRRALTRQITVIEPVLAEGGITFDLLEPTEVHLQPDAVRFFLREAMPQLEERGVPVLLPAEWLSSSSSRLRVNLTATSGRGARSSGLFSTNTIASFDWQLAIGDTTLSEEQLLELAAAKEPLIRVGGRWHALRRSDVERALRFLERRRRDAGVVDLVRAVSGLETDEAGLELGTVTLDDSLAELLAGGDERRFHPLGTPAGMSHPLFPFQERGHGWLRMLGDLGVGAILADDMGLGKTVQAIATFVSEREQPGGDALGPTLVICPMSVTRQWMKEIERFAPALRVHLHHGSERLAGPELAAVALKSDVVVTSYDVATRDVDDLATVPWDRLLLDEAQDVKNPATKRARALRRLPARKRLAMTGTPIENRLGDLWALMDIVNPGLLGSHERFDRTFARPIEMAGDDRALERLRGLVQPFILRRPKDAPEVEIELPGITIAKEYCNLTLEQASLYRATVDRWMPRIEEHQGTFGRRGAVLAMLGQLKQVCNHPEMLLATGRPLEGRSGKLERLIELLEQVPKGDKSLVFTQYPGFDRLVPHLEERLGKSVGFFHGGLSARRREELIAAFDDPDGPELLVISIRAGGRGLNLPMANHVFHFDRWWNPAVEQQATDRVYRFGQRKDVFVHSLICTATLEERIDQLLESKRELADKVVATRSEDWLGELDLDAIRAAVALAPETDTDAGEAVA
jgi:SNF2-related domain/SNF2 Helicase protein/Helicase conserved C-terminal domain